MKQKSTVLIFFLFLLFSSLTAGQTLYFCEGVDKDGNPENDSRTFTIPDDGGYLYFLVKMPYELDCYSVSFVIYSINSDGDETYDNTITLDTEPDWDYFWKQVNFYENGKFKVYVYDEDNELLTSGMVRVNYE